MGFTLEVDVAEPKVCDDLRRLPSTSIHVRFPSLP
jgi:hypothetical protein